MTSLTWIKRITGIGLCLMSPEAQKERMDAIVSVEDGKKKINGPALAALIDECKASAAAFLNVHSGSVSEEQKGVIRKMLAGIDGKQIAANMCDDTDAAWLLELKDRVDNHTLTPENLKDL